MMSWWKILEATAFVLHHVSGVIDTIVAKYNPIEDGQSLVGKLWYLSDIDHVIKIFKGLGMSNDPDFALAEKFLKQGEFEHGTSKLYELENKLAITIDSQFLFPIIQSFATPDIDILSSDIAYNFQRCVNSTFPIAFQRYQSRFPDIMSRIEIFMMNPIEKIDLLIFLQCLQYIEPDNELDTETLSKSLNSKSFILDEDLISENSADVKLFNKFYVPYKPVKDKNWNGIQLCVPFKSDSELPGIMELFQFTTAKPTMRDFFGG